jgi:hypothetical protein
MPGMIVCMVHYSVPTPIAAGAPTPYTGIYTAPLDLSRRSLNGKSGNAPGKSPSILSISFANKEFNACLVGILHSYLCT